MDIDSHLKAGTLYFHTGSENYARIFLSLGDSASTRLLFFAEHNFQPNYGSVICYNKKLLQTTTSNYKKIL